MPHILIYFFIAIGLSMDAFSVALSIGTTNPSKKNIIKTGLSVGLFHFIMPTLGSILGKILKRKINIGTNYIISIIFLVLAIEMYFNKEEKTKIDILNTITILLISFSVSIDSFSVGLGISLLKNSILIPSIIFSIISMIFTIIGMFLGKKLKNKYNKIATNIGIIILILLSLKYLFL